jgi:hypothetical protein
VIRLTPGGSFPGKVTTGVRLDSPRKPTGFVVSTEAEKGKIRGTDKGSCCGDYARGAFYRLAQNIRRQLSLE